MSEVVFEDKTIKCSNCGREFVFSAGEQEFYAEKGFDDPKKCKHCRLKEKHRTREDARIEKIAGKVFMRMMEENK